MLAFIRVARREKGRRGNPINRYSSTLKCGNDCRVRFRPNFFFFATLVERAARSTPRHKDGVIDIADFQKPGMPRERNERGTACRSTWNLSISRLRQPRTYADTERASS